MRRLALVLASLLAFGSCSTIEETLDKYTLNQAVMDKVLADASQVAFALSAAFEAADADNDDEVRGLEWITFVRTAIEKFKDIRGVSVRPVTLEALQKAGVVFEGPLFAAESRKPKFHEK